MKTQKKNKRVLITGCSSGFGMLAAVAAAKAGFEVIATMRNLLKSEFLAQLLKREAVTATIDELDITKPETIERIVDKYKPIDILVNNAGMLMGGSFLDITEVEARKVFETNYFGAVALTKAVAPQMMQRKQGLIINIASLAGLVGHMFNSSYSASKHALVGFSRSIRMELKPFNIKVVSVEPGYHRTEIIGNNAYLSENFYNRESPMFDLNRGFLRLMMKEVRPRAGDPAVVAKKIVEIMQSQSPRKHYIIGKDAALTTLACRLGLGGVLEKLAYDKLLRQRERAKSRKKRKKST